ncbi:MAG: ATP-dependent DNA helicase [Candidatus Helarchaeota archaeon]
MISIPSSIRKFFPYNSLRPGQGLLMNEIYDHLKLPHKFILIEAANGSGKTITTLSAIIPIIKQNNLTMIYATRTHTQMDRVIAELEEINKKGSDQGYVVRGLTLKGKTEMCLNEEVRRGTIMEITDLCSQLRKNGSCKYFTNLQNFEYNLKTGKSEELIAIGVRYNICPYYLAKRLLKETDVIITTFNYLIHPFIRQIFFKDIDKLISDCIIVFDEGHNIINVALEAGTQQITPRSVKRALDELIGLLLDDDVPSIQFLKDIKSFIETTGMAYDPKEGETIEIAVRKSTLKNIFSQIKTDNIENFFNNLIEKGVQVRELMLKNNKLPRSSLYKTAHFLQFIYQNYLRPDYIHILRVSKVKNKINVEFVIKTLDVRPILNDLFNARNLVIISGTLAPIRAFREICGMTLDNTKERILPSPFPFENVSIIGVQDITLKFEDRTEENYRFIMNCCVEAAKNTKYNTGVFCASYSVINGLLEQGLKEKIEELGIKFFMESKSMNSKENEAMITEYKKLPYKGMRGFLIGASGGRNSEGVDFPGKEMSTVVIVGIPFAKISYSIKKLIKYYQNLFGEERGLEYAYYIPALRKANQSAGRPIRKLDDKGIIIFLDERFFYKKYFKLLSNWIQDRIIKIEKYEGLVGRIVKMFYNKINL